MSHDSHLQNDRYGKLADPKGAVGTGTTAGAPDYQQLARHLIENVIEPVAGPLDPRIKVAVSAEPPLLVLEHAARSPQGGEYTFRYEIRLDGKKISPGPIPQPNVTSQLEFLPGPHSQEIIVKMQDAFRCATVHDPVLYGRFNRKELQLEDYQNEAVQALLSDLFETNRALLVLGTGGGKTQIAFEVMKEVLSRSPDLKDAVAVFVVNNNIILSEAAEKFREVSNGTLAVSHAHAGSRDTSGDIVCATPGTLIGDSILEELIASKKQVLIIFDEVHHVVASQPDQIISRAMAAAVKTGTELRFMGLTATETRPDLKSVLSYFNNHITFERSAADLTSRGFLVPFTYHAADEWLHPEHKPPTCILPNDEGATERRDLLNSTAAFTHIESALDAHVRNKEDRRTLIVAPSVDLAGELKAHLNDNPEYQGTVVRLTAQDRETDPLRFKDTYEAWKKGRWPKGSPFADEPIPEIVVAVDLFKEGADAPAVQTIINWADTNSLIVFLQTLGRGLRPSPFKTNLTVVDVCGTFRKAHLLQYLGSASEPRKEQGQTDADRERDNDDRNEAPPIEVRQLCELGPEVSRTVQAFVGDVARCIVRRYPNYHYSALPAQEIEKLHTYLAQECGFESTIPFDNLLKQIATSLTVDASMKAAQEGRQKLLQAFFGEDESPLSDSPNGIQIDREDRTFLIHNHLCQTMQTLVPELTLLQLARIFPEFSAETLDAVKTIGGNLMTLRHRYFNLDPADMAQELLEKVVNKRLLADDPGAESTIFTIQCNRHDASDIIRSVEARSMSRSHPENGTPLGWEQRAVLLAMLRHPDIAGKLQESDFLLPRKDFENLLAAKDLVTLVAKQGSGDVLQFISGILNDIVTATRSDDGARMKSAMAAAKPQLANLLSGSFLEERRVTKHRFVKLREIQNALTSTESESSALAEINTLFDKVVGKITKREVLELSSLPGVTISGHYVPESKSVAVTLNGLKKAIPLDLPICADFVHPHILIPSARLFDLDEVYSGMSEIQKQDVVGTLTTLIEKMVKKLPFSAEWAEANSPVIVVPTMSDGVAKDLGVALLRDTQLDVLTVGNQVTSSASAVYNLHCSIDQALRSRVGDITEESMRKLRQVANKSLSDTFEKDLLHAYEVVNFARSTVALHRAQWLALFTDHTLRGESLRHVEAAREPLVRLLERGTTIGPRRFSAVKAYTSILQAVVNAGGFTEDSALLAATWTTLDRAPLGAFNLRTSPFVAVRRDIQTFLVRLSDALEHGIELSADDKESVREILRTIFNATLGASDRNPPFIKGLSKEEQAPALEAIRVRAVAISERIEASLSLQSTPQAEETEEKTMGNARREGYPFFGADQAARVFLSGSKLKPTMHFDPECPLRTSDLTKRVKKELPLGPVTYDEVEEALGYKEKATCCKGCKVPSWKDQKTYSDIAGRFRWNANTSALLPNKFETKQEVEGE
ncbi:MAG: hypothetical protein RL518_279 [Pseudomonadota bacterium]